MNPRDLTMPLKRSVARRVLKTGPLLAYVFDRCIPIPFSGMRIDTASPLVNDDTRAALYFYMYESSERRAIKRFLRSNRPVVELGASIGFVSVLIAKTAHPVKQVAVEANPDLIPLLRRNLELNGVAGVTIVHGAVAYKTGDRAIFSVGAANVDGRLGSGVTAEAGVQSLVVPTTTLRDVLESSNISEFTLVSDIEGAEWDLIEEESKDTRERCRQAVFELHHVERNGTTFTPAELADRFATGWGMRKVHTDGKVWVFER
jgi:FkbM family methyltransferase